MGWTRLTVDSWMAAEPGGLQLAGEFDVTAVSAAEPFARDAIDDGSGTVELDLSRVTFWDARALTLLLTLEHRARSRGCELSLAFPSRCVRQLLQLAGLADRFRVSSPAVRPASDHERAVLDAGLVEAAEVDRTQRATSQLVDPSSGALVLVAAPGFDDTFSTFFEIVRDQGSVCGTAARNRRPVAVGDVATSAIFADSPARDIMLGAGSRACLSLPILDPDDHLVAMISTHHSRPHVWGAETSRALERVARRVGRSLHALRPEIA